MAAGQWTLFSNAELYLAKGQVNLLSDTLVMVLLTSAWTPAPNTNAIWSDISANEVTTGAGYTAGGVAMTSQTVSLSTATTTVGAADATWAAFSATFKYGVLVRRAGGSLVAGDLLLQYFDASSGGGSITGLAGTLTVQVATPHLMTITKTP